MIRSALSSSAFIGASVHDVIEYALAAGVQGIEWSDDGFLEPGDPEAARAVMMETLRAGLCTASYATLYRAGFHEPRAFAAALETARSLHAPLVRVWASPRLSLGVPADGAEPAGDLDADERAFVDAARKHGDEAAECGVTVCFSLAKGSLLDSYAAAARVFARIDHSFVKLAWEPFRGSCFDGVMEDFFPLRGRIGLLLARSVGPDGSTRPLGSADEDWLEYLDAYDEQGGDPDMVRHVVLGSGWDGDRGVMAADAASIRRWGAELRRYHRRRVYGP